MIINHSTKLSRRKFLGTLGAVAVAVSTPGFFTARDALAQSPPKRFVIREDRFGRIFPDLPPFATPSPGLEAAMRDIGKPGGMLDAKDDLLAGPVQLIVDPTLSANNPDNTTHTAGTTFVGQFLDHDMTFDLSSRLGVPTEPAASANSRTPAFDLDSVYGGGPLADPELYVAEKGQRQPTKFNVENGGLFEDVPRDTTGKAIIADPRNDENMMISGLQAAFLKFHNRAVDLVTAEQHGESPDEVFRRARQLTTWHYQWMIVHEFLPLFIGQALVDDILENGRKFYRPDVVQIPVEFQGAAYRFGHSMVRPSYRANLAGDESGPFFGMIFDPTAEGEADPRDLRGGLGRGGASSAGRHSSISAAFPDRVAAEPLARMSGRTSGSTRESPLRCSPCRWARSPPGTRPLLYRSVTCSVSSPGSCRPARASLESWASQRSTRTT